MKPYRTGKREELALVKEFRRLFPDAEVYRMPLSRGAIGRSGDLLLVLDGVEFSVSAKYGNQVPTWCYQAALFTTEDGLVAGPLWLLLTGAQRVLELVPRSGRATPAFVRRELEYADMLCVRARRGEWRVILDQMKLAGIWRLQEEVVGAA